MITVTAPAKVILFGEHAVVYARPAIAVPVSQVYATASIEPAGEGDGLTILATDLERTIHLRDAAPDDTLALAARQTLSHVGLPEPDVNISISSTIPVASGMGSGAAVSTVIVRALTKFLDRDLNDAAISNIVYEVEKLYHGTPSGLDNTVIAYARPVYFIRGYPIQTFEMKRPFTLAIGDTGVSSPTKIAVGDVRKAWREKTDRYESIFDQIGKIVSHARNMIEAGDIESLGRLMDVNHALLRELNVSSAKLDRLVSEAKSAGALGAKLVGAGRGGNMIALIGESKSMRKRVKKALLSAGAKGVLVSKITMSGDDD